MTRFTRSANGKYVVHNKSFDMLIGTRAQVWHGTAHKTSGNLTKSDLLQNKNGRIVSKAKHASAKKDNRLVKAGYGTQKGKFGFVKMNGKTKSKRGGAPGNMGNNSNSNMGNNNNNNNNNSSNSSNNMMKMAAMKKMNGGAPGNMGNNSNSNMGNNNNNNNNNNSSNSSNNMMKMAAIKNMGGNKSGGRSRKSRRGGSGMYALSPSSYAYSGNGSGTSGVDLQFIAGNAG